MPTIPINDTTPRNSYTATASQTVFPYTFWIIKKEDVRVLQNGTELTVDTDYTVDGLLDTSGGNVTLTTGAADGDSIIIIRDMPIDRLTEFTTSGDFRASVLNLELSKMIAIFQQLETKLNRTLKLPEASLVNANNLLLPNTLNDNKGLKFDAATGAYVETTFDPDEAQTLAQTAQAAAETARTGAETARTGAETARTGAETAQAAAQTAETNAAASETKASKWADNDEDVPVETGPDKFSAKHWAAKAAASAAGLAVDISYDPSTSGLTATNVQAAIDEVFTFTVPTASIMPYAGSTSPSGWLLCDGSAVSRTTYAGLFTALGTTYGVGDGSTTFNLPDMRGRVAMAMDNMGGTSANRVTDAQADTLGGSGGQESVSGSTGSHTLTVSEMPSHSHLGPNVAWQGRYGTGDTGITSPTWETAGSASDTTGAYSQPVGGGQGHSHSLDVNTMSPYLALNWIIKT